MIQRLALLDEHGDLVDLIMATRPWPSSVIHLGRVFVRDEHGGTTAPALRDELPPMIYREERL